MRADAGAAVPVRAALLRMLVEVEKGGNSSLLLEHARIPDERDRGLATELLFGILRRLAALDWLAGQVADRSIGGLDPVVRAAVRLGIYQTAFLDRVPAYAAVDATVEAVKLAAGHPEAAFVNGLLRAFDRRRATIRLPGAEDIDRYLGITLSLPPWLSATFRARFGDEATVKLAEAASRPAEVMLRVQAGRATVAEVVERLAAEQVGTRPGRYLEETLVVTSGHVARTSVFRNGMVMIQDEAAQMVARLVDAQPRMRVLDACAAPGGKSVAIADLAAGKARIFAADLRPGRLRMVGRNRKRVAARGIHLVVMDARQPAFAAGRFERILLDAPCTGTGTIRRNPELRERASADSVARSAERAVAIARATAACLAPGGRLVYATCSVEPEENESVIDDLLAADPTLMRVDPRPALPEPAHELIGPDGALHTWPRQPDLDGFSAFVLERRGDA